MSKVNINEVVSGIENIVTRTVDINGQKIDIEIKKSISLKEYSKMISDILDMIFDFKSGKYLAYNTRFAIQYNIIKYFTNIDTKNKERIFDLLNKTEIFHYYIEPEHNPSYYCIEEEVLSAVDFIKQSIFKSNPWNDVAKSIKGFIDKLDKFADKFSDVDNQDIQKGLELISNMTTNDLKDIVLKELKQNENKWV